MTPSSNRLRIDIARKRIRGFGDRARTVLDPRDPSTKPPVRQVREMIRLRRATPALGMREYHDYRLHDLELWGDVDIDDVGGLRAGQWLHTTLNNPNWDAVVSDKVIMSMVFRQAGIPHAELLALYTRYDRTCASVPVLRDRGQLRSFMTSELPFPAFVKPIVGGHGDSCHRIDAIDAESTTLTVDGHLEMSIDAFIDILHDHTGWGFQFQHALGPSEATKPLLGDALSGLRMVVLLGDDGPTLFRAIWKLPAPGTVTDNYGIGDRGNGVAAIDVDTGVVERSHWGRGSRERIDAPHPSTGVTLTGSRVPQWDEVVRVILAAAQVFPGFRFQHWDVGLTDRGPVVYELNNGGGLYDGDLPGSRGTCDDELRAFVAEYGHETQHQRHRGTVVS